MWDQIPKLESGAFKAFLFDSNELSLNPIK